MGEVGIKVNSLASSIKIDPELDCMWLIIVVIFVDGIVVHRK